MRAFAEHDDAPAADHFPQEVKVGEIDILGVDRTNRKGVLFQIRDSGRSGRIHHGPGLNQPETLADKRKQAHHRQ